MAPFKPAFRINPFPCPPDVSFFKSGHPFNMNLILQMQELCLTTVGLVFLWSGVAKLAASGDFKTTLWQIPHLPAGLVPAIHWLLPPVEIGIAVGLVWGLTAAKLAATGLLTTFCLLAFVVMQARLKVHCSCFGSGNRVFSGWTIAQNLFLIGLVGLGTPARQTVEIPMSVLTAAVVLVVGLSAVTLRGNRKLVGELRRLHIL